MRNVLFWIAAVCLGFVAFVVIGAVDNALSPSPTPPAPVAFASVRLGPPPRAPVTAAASMELPPAPVPEPAKADPAPLAAHVLEAMRSWAKEDKGAAPFESIAWDIADVALSERPAFDTDESHGKTAILLAAIGYYEGARYRDYVDRGLCNDIGWRVTPIGVETLKQGNCDSGIAYGLGQVHPEGGLVLYDDAREWAYASMDRGAKAITGPDMIADRRLHFRVVLHMARRSIRAGAGLCQYSHEFGPCPKGDERLHFAQRWSAGHAFAGR